MTKTSENEERDAVDNITNAMFSVSFLDSISDFIFSNHRDSMTVGQFYNNWLKKVSPNQLKIPLSPGILLGLMYVALVYGREIWENIIPNDDIKKIDDEWGIKDADFKCSKEPNPTLRYVIRRLRNSLGHGNVNIIIPKDIKYENRFDKFQIKFHDKKQNKKQKDPSDTLDVTLTLNEIFKFIKKFQNFIHKHVRNKYKISTRYV